jgi:S-DNA-T family DNA segregation ATPase FtsK/SpoIIIE
VTPLELLGGVAVANIERTLDAAAGDEGFARFLLSSLSEDEILAIVGRVREDARVSDRIEVLLPRHRFAGREGIPEEILTDKTETVLRHLECVREGRLTVLSDESQRQSLAQLTRVDADVLLANGQVETWIAEAGGGGLDPERRQQLQAALVGVLGIGRAPLRHFAAFVLETVDRILQGESVEVALGRSLMALRVPRHDHLFEGIPAARRGWQSTWRDRLRPHWRRTCYFAKRDLKQLPISRAWLVGRLEASEGRLPAEVRADLEAYIEAPEAVGPETLAPFRHDWSLLDAFFEEAPAKEKDTIGKKTLAYYERDPDLLDEEEWSYVRHLATRRGERPAKQPEDEAFFRAHARELQEESRLSAMWERFIYGQRVECTDLVDGLVQCLRRLYDGKTAGRRVIVVEGIERSPAHFAALNDDACRAFETRYRGIGAALDGVVEFRNVRALTYSELPGRPDGGRRKEPPTSKKARRLSFKVWLETVGVEEVDAGADVRLIWECELSAIGMKVEKDLERLRKGRRGPMVVSIGGRRTISRERSGIIDLSDTACLEPERSRDRGSFVPREAQRTALDAQWKAGLEEMGRRNLVTAPATIQLLEHFLAFERDYKAAISDLATSGWSSPSVVTQARSFGALLERIAAAATTPLALETLLRPLLSIGVAQIEPAFGHETSALVCPWHPLRLAGLRSRWLRLAASIRPVLSDEPVTFTDTGALFFTELRRDLGHVAEPEVVAVWDGEKPTLLTLADHLNGYSLHERPVTVDGAAVATGESVKADARQISAVVDSYLRLQPHERDNLSIVLYDSDAAALPQAVVDSIQASGAGDGETMCQVMLRHTDGERLRELYRQLVSRATDQDAMHASESTRDFMSRLRISIMVNEGPTEPAAGGPPCDLVFCHDVIARRARLDWRAVQRHVQAGETFRPGEWSRRVPIGRGEHDSSTLLVRPVQQEEGWAYLRVLASMFEPEAAGVAQREDQCLVPVRKTDIRAPQTRDTIDETHRLGNWVVNIDGLLDKRQLQERGITVIRHKRGEGEGRNLIISSRTSDALLRSTLAARISALDPGYTPEQVAALAAKLIADANAISGDLVLRAARRGSSANELLGVVLSSFLVSAELGAGREFAWVFLDDYASWLGQDEHRIADLLCLAPRVVDGVPVLEVVVTEAKYVGVASMASKAKESARQLTDTLLRLERALDATSAVADRRIWRARLTEMLLDGMRGTAFGDAVDWATVLRDEDRSRITVRGYSHVFGHAPPEALASAVDAYLGVKGTGGRQEMYAPDSLRELLRAYADGTDPMEIRRRLWDGVTPDIGGQSDGASPRRAAAEPNPAPQSGGGDGGPGLPEPEAEHPPAPVNNVAVVPRGRRFLSLIESYAEAQAAVAPDEDGWLDQAATRCTNALMRYGMSAQLVESVLTPNAALLKYRGADNLTVAKVENRAQELETTHALEVLNVRAQPGRIVISIRRPQRARLTLAGVWSSWDQLRVPPTEGNSRLLIAVNEDDGTAMYLQPHPTPHTLVAGSTGSGKSVLVQNILLAIAATNTPRLAQILLIDPKGGVDYYAFEDLPHLQDGIVADTEEALARLDGLVAEMERRYLLFRGARVSNLDGYNKKNPAEPLPAIWAVHDEFADWMQIDTYSSAVEGVVSRLGVKARAAGIYLIFAAQRPDSSVFPMQLRSNLGNRLILKVDSVGTSDISLGQKNGAAERLLGQGHMAALVGGAASPAYAQVPFVDEGELAELVRALIDDQLELDDR